MQSNKTQSTSAAQTGDDLEDELRPEYDAALLTGLLQSGARGRYTDSYHQKANLAELADGVIVVSRAYDYIGSDELRGSQSQRHRIHQPQDVKDWMTQTGQWLEHGMVVATFIVDTGGQLWIADRHSEHVACANGRAVLSAGEMTFVLEGEHLSITEVSNQSLGYCPEPASWPAVASALEGSRLSSPSFFTSAYTMRLCEECGAKNIVKDEIYECGVCQSILPAEWNFGRRA